MANLVLGVAIGFLWGFCLFFMGPVTKEDLRKEGAIQVYEGQMKCEKAMGVWVCGNPQVNQGRGQ